VKTPAVFLKADSFGPDEITMKRLAIQYVIFLTLTVFSGFILVLAFIGVALLSRRSTTAVSSPPQQAVTAIVTITPSEDLPTASPVPTPTASPVPEGVVLDWIPTLIPPVEVLPTPQPETAHVTGRLLCNGSPRSGQFVVLTWIDGTSYRVIETMVTDGVGRWLFKNAPPVTVSITGEHPKSMPIQIFNIKPDQVNDLGDIDLPPRLCN
jgi:hypothetical protein